MIQPLLSLQHISKVYPGVIALDDVSFSVRPGEVVALLGENGAGKSTLMKILGGVIQPSRGTITIEGRERASLSVADAIAAGIAFVHQELNLFDNLDAAANVFIGREPLRGGVLKLVDRRKLRRQAAPLFDRLKLDFSPDTPVANLSIAQRQLLEIVKALSLDARIVIMDEPTSSLTLTETARLLRVIGELKASGVAIIFISHRLLEVEACADRAVVLRDGRVAGELAKGEIDHGRMIRLMIGRDLKSLYVPPAARPRDAVLEIDGLRTAAYPDRTVDIALRRGEILGLAGLVGSGRSELARAVFGIDQVLGGAVRLDGKPYRGRSPRDAIGQGIYLVPEDRKRAGLLLDFGIAENVALPNLRALSAGGLVSRAREADAARQQTERLAIRAPDIATRVNALSGGNQQKVVLAKWLAMKPRVVIFDEPTRGVDVGAKAEIYGILRQLADAGIGVLMISSDMEEVIGVSDRIAVMHEGVVAGVLERAEFSEQTVLNLAVGAGRS